MKYIELRTTPRAVPDTGMTKESYLAAVLSAVRENEDDIVVRLLLAVDRKRSLQDAWDTLEMTDRLRKESNGIVIGMDLSGDPTVCMALSWADLEISQITESRCIGALLFAKSEASGKRQDPTDL